MAPAAKFDETVEVHFRLGLNVRHADEQLRGTIMLPHGIGKDVQRSPSSPRARRRARREDAGADVIGSADSRGRRSRKASSTSTSRSRRLTR